MSLGFFACLGGGGNGATVRLAVRTMTRQTFHTRRPLPHLAIAPIAAGVGCASVSIADLGRFGVNACLVGGRCGCRSHTASGQHTTSARPIPKIADEAVEQGDVTTATHIIAVMAKPRPDQSTPSSYATVTSLRTFDRPAARSPARSCAVCIASHPRAAPTPADSRRTARLGELRACSLMTRLRVTRDTPSAAACPIFCPFFGRAHTHNLWANGALRSGLRRLLPTNGSVLRTCTSGISVDPFRSEG